MRFRLFLALSSASLVMTGLGIQACGGDTDTAATSTPDSSVPDTYSPPHDAATDTADAAPPCDPNNDYLASVPDASLADGATSTGACIACTKANCEADITACGADCTCQAVATGLLTCYSKSQNITSCLGALISVPTATRMLGTNLFTCVSGKCTDECAINSFIDAGADTGVDAAP